MQERLSAPRETSFSVRTLESGGITIETPRVEQVFEYAIDNPRSAISDTETGMYVVHSPSRIQGESEPDVNWVVIAPVGDEAIVQLVPADFDKEHRAYAVDDTISGLSLVHEQYEAISSFPSLTFDGA